MILPLVVASVASVAAAEPDRAEPAFHLRKIKDDLFSLEIVGPPGKPARIFTDAVRVMGDRFMDFPVQGALQFKDNAGKAIVCKAPRGEDWLYPSIFQSTLNIGNGETALKEMDLGVGQVWSDHFRCGRVLDLAKSNLVGGAGQHIAAWRVKIDLRVASTADEKPRVVQVESDWIRP